MRRKPFEGRCRCEDCDLPMEWDGTEWTMLDGRLHCSPCTVRDIKKGLSRHGRTVMSFHRPKPLLKQAKVKKAVTVSGGRRFRALP